MTKMSKKDLAKQIMETKAKIDRLNESKNGLAFLIESDLEKASLVMGAKSIVSDLQSYAEKIAKIEVDQLMPIIDQLKSTFGAQAAESFYRSSTTALRDLVDQIQKTKDAVSDQVINLENGVAGQPMNDINNDGLDGDLGDDLATDDSVDDTGEEMVGDEDEAPAPEVPEEDSFDDESFGDDMTNAAGRARKESVEKFEKAILEFFKRAVKEGKYRPSKAAKIVAEGFKVDVDDVKQIVSEAAGK